MIRAAASRSCSWTRRGRALRWLFGALEVGVHVVEDVAAASDHAGEGGVALIAFGAFSDVVGAARPSRAVRSAELLLAP